MDLLLTAGAVVLFGASVVLLVWGVFSVAPVVGRLVTRSFWCPFRGRNVSAGFTEEAWAGTPVGVTRCSAFTPPTAITCHRLCLKLKGLPESR
jgi:hypothetical protein